MDAAALVDWSRAALRPDARRSRPTLRTMFVPVVCPACGDERWLRTFDARRMVRQFATDATALPICLPCHARAIAPLGFRAAVAKYPRWRWELIRRVRAYRIDHPSQPERMMTKMFARIGVVPEREYILATKAHGRRQRFYLLDFVSWLPTGAMVAIEVDCAYTHANARVQARDRRKERLCKRRGIVLVRFTDVELRTAAGMQRLCDLFMVPVPSAEAT